MRSIRYIMGGDPRNLDDCVDLVRNKNQVPDTVALQLELVEYPNEMLVMVKQMMAVFIWKFTDRTVEYEELCSACIFTESAKRQMKSVDNANIRLEKSLSGINSLHIDVAGGEKRFDYSAIYKRGTVK